MVQMTNFGMFRPESEFPAVVNSELDVKAEIEDDLEEQFGPSTKRFKMIASTSSMQQFGAGIPPYNAVNEPGLLGLRLKKSPSLLDLIQMKLSQEVSKKRSRMTNITDEKEETTRDNRVSSAPVMAEKLKASNFPASLLKIGTWEYVSTYEGDLVAKCYFAKHKIVWEVLEGGLKSKIEIQWSDIKALKGVCPEDGPGTLEIVLARQPQFFRETNPQPRKHTLWQATSDFTNGQASIYRRHFLQCPQGTLDKHFEKLIQCDPRLYALSQQPDFILENPYFEQRCSGFEGRNESDGHSLNHMNGSYGSVVPAFQDVPLAYAGPLVSRADVIDPSQIAPTHSHSAGPVSQFNVHNSAKGALQSTIWDQFRDPSLQHSMPVSALLNNIGSYISERFNAGNVGVIDDLGQSSRTWVDVAQNLLSDSQFFVSDERSLLAKVNSFCTLLQHEANTVENRIDDCGIGNSLIASEKQFPAAGEGELVIVNEAKPSVAISRKDSLGELLMHLPRIASLPTFLADISKELGN